MFYAGVALAAAVPIALGVLVARRGSRPIGWLLIAHGVSVALLLAPSRLTSTSTSTMAIDQLLGGSWIFLFLWLVLIAYLLPDGRLPTRRWRIWVVTGLTGAAVFLVGAAGDQNGFRQEHDGRPPPLAVLPEPVAGLFGAIGLLLTVALFFGSVLAVRSRLKRADNKTRLQLLWLVWGALAVPVGLLVLWANYFLLGGVEWLADVVLTAVSVALPCVIAIAILRYRMFDVRFALSRTLTYGTLVLAILVLYAGLLVAARQLGGDGTLGGLLAVAIVASAAQPASAWLRRRVERWVYGYRSNPTHALRLLAVRAEAAEPDELTGIITDAVAEALRVDHVWVETGGVETGERDVGRIQRVPLVHRGDQLGALAVDVPAGRQLSSLDLALLSDLAHYAAVLVRSERQGTQLRESRSRIVNGREEERRRLRRDLHDGLGPSLAAIVLTLNAAQSRTDGEQRSALLAQAREEVRQAIAEVRRLVDDMRPPAIDEVGLLGAVRQRATALSGALTFEVEGPDPMPDLPAAVEVAAFRIASEAMTNVVRHSGATRCRVNMSVNGRFELAVIDNGHGVGRSPATDGAVGWASMRERAAELGGRCTFSIRPEGGLLVQATLPLQEQEQAGSEGRT